MTKTAERVLGGDINDTPIETLGAKFEELSKTLAEKKYGVKMSTDGIAYLTLELLPKFSWDNRGAFDIIEMIELVNRLDSETEVPASKEAIRALFHFVLAGKSVGVDHVHTIKNVLLALSEVVAVTNADDQMLQDAGFELQAAEQGITPEKAVEGMQESQVATEGNTLQPVK